MAYQYRKFKRAHRERIDAALGHPRVGHLRHEPVDVKARHKLLKCCDLVYLPVRYIRYNNHAAR